MEGGKVNNSDLEETDNDSQQQQLSKAKKKKAALISSSSDGDDSSEENVKMKAAEKKLSKPSKKSNKLGFTTESNDSDGKNIYTLIYFECWNTLGKFPSKRIARIYQK